MSSSDSLEAPSDNTQAVASLRPLPPDLLLLVFIHGFKGTDSTFSTFPQRLQHNLQETISDVVVKSIVFPAYEVCVPLSPDMWSMLNTEPLIRLEENW